MPYSLFTNRVNINCTNHINYPLSSCIPGTLRIGNTSLNRVDYPLFANSVQIQNSYYINEIMYSNWLNKSEPR